MKEKYLYIFLLILITSFSAQAQTAKNSGIAEQTKTENTLDKVQITRTRLPAAKYILTQKLVLLKI